MEHPNALTAHWGEWVNLHTSLAWVYEGEVPRENLCGDYRPDHLGAWLLLKGSAVLKQPGRTVHAKVGQWLIPWPGQRHQEFSDDAHILSVRFKAHWPDGKPLFDSGLSVVFDAADYPGLERVARELLACSRRHVITRAGAVPSISLTLGDFVGMQVAVLPWIDEYTRTLCALGLRPTRIGVDDERVLDTLQRLDAYPLSCRLRESNIASEVGLGVSQLVRIFREAMGATPKQYFDQRRRAFCQSMLSSTSVPIKEISYSLGFTRLSDFSAWFKHNFNISPRSFRQNSRRASSV
jgi:AraC-like DNA-binding protein